MGDHIYSSSIRINDLVWVYGGGTHISIIIFQNQIISNFSEIFDISSDWFRGINLASFCLNLPYFIFY